MRIWVPRADAEPWGIVAPFRRPTGAFPASETIGATDELFSDRQVRARSRHSGLVGLSFVVHRVRGAMAETRKITAFLVAGVAPIRSYAGSEAP